jgi:D-beta-D-heptose 7-phosphate kinase/D-beta-D-heptose 1-phosphate adenosyltransferase
MLDRYFWGVVDRISPEAPVPVVKVNRRSARLGGAANVAANLRALGAQVSLLGTVGHDPAGQEIQNLLSAKGIDATGLVVGDDRDTTEKVRIIAQSQQVVRADFEEPEPISGRIVDFLMTRFEKQASDCDVLIVSDYGKGVIQDGYLKEIIGSWHRSGKWLLIDPHVGHFHWYKGAGLITPNAKEAASRYGEPVDGDETISQLGRRLKSDLDLEALLITRGEAGMSLFYEGDKEFHVPTVAKEVYDVTGAGDTVISVLGAMLGAGVDLVDSVVIANQAAGEVVKEVGTTTISTDMIVNSIL